MAGWLDEGLRLRCGRREVLARPFIHCPPPPLSPQNRRHRPSSSQSTKNMNGRHGSLEKISTRWISKLPRYLECSLKAIASPILWPVVTLGSVNGG